MNIRKTAIHLVRINLHETVCMVFALAKKKGMFGISNVRPILLTVLCLIASSSFAQVNPSSELYITIMTKDAQLFDVGFNTCDISQFENLLSSQFEFLHDKDGVSDKEGFLYNLRNGLCGSPDKYQSRRELIDTSTEVFPLYKKEKIYAAVQKGVHQFYETMAGTDEKFASSARFTHVWFLEDNKWKLRKSLSYDHKTDRTTPEQASLFDNDDEIEAWLESNNIPTLGIGVIKKGQLQQVRVFGQLEAGKPAPYNTIFNVASLAKPVTAIVALKLVSAGKWSLDEPIFTYWTDPDVINDPRSKLLTTRHILSHQTGFPNWRYMNQSKKLDFKFSPGEQYQYSGEGLEYLRKALENKFGKSLNELATELIFSPLSMSDTQYIFNASIDENRFAQGYDNKGNAYQTIKNQTANAADDLLTSIEDYGKFLVAVLNRDGISGQVYKEMTSHQVESTKGKHFGLGFEIYDFDDGDFALSHGGADNGAQTIVFIFPETKDGLLIFTNVDDGYKVYEKLLLHYLGKKGKQIIKIEMSQ